MPSPDLLQALLVQVAELKQDNDRLQRAVAQQEQENATLRAELRVCQQFHTSAQRAVDTECVEQSEQAQQLKIAREQEKAAQERAAELTGTDEKLRRRDRLLEMTAVVANALLTIVPLDVAVNTALRIIGESLETDRVKVLECVFDDASAAYPAHYTMSYEWIAAGTISQLSHPSSSLISICGAEAFMESLYQNDGFGGLLREWPESFWSAFEAVQAKAIYCVPIRVERELWGVLVFDDCHKTKQRNAVELSVLKIAADCIGSAIQRERTQQALLEAEQARSQELAKANEALKRSLDSFASEPSLDKFLGQVLTAIAQQFNSPMAEYWYHLEDTAYIGMMSWQGQIFDREEISKRHSTHPGVTGFKVTPEMIYGESLQHRKRYFIREDWFSDPFVKHVKWMPENGLYKEINVPMVLGDNCVGALIVRLTREQQITTQQIELAQALAHQATLAAQLTRLAEEAKQAAIAREQEKAAQERVAELAKANGVLQNCVDRLAGQLNPESFINHVLLEAAAQVNAHTAALFVYNDTETQSMQAFVQNGQVQSIAMNPDLALFRNPVPRDAVSLWDSALSKNEAVCFNLDNEKFCTRLQWHLSQGHRSIVRVPLLLGTHLLGFIGFCFHEPRSHLPQNVELVMTLAQQATVALQLAQLAEQNRQVVLIEERNRIAREIHDTLAQTFTGISIQLNNVQYLADRAPDVAWSMIEQVKTLAHQGLSEARRSVWALQPDADEYRDLAGSLQRAVHQLTASTPLQATLSIIGTPFKVPADIGMNLLRIAQESMTNTLRHAHAYTLLLELTFAPDAITLQVSDDGQGFDPELHTGYGGFGLVGMQQRCDRLNGQFSLFSQLGQGTTIVVQIPLLHP